MNLRRNEILQRGNFPSYPLCFQHWKLVESIYRLDEATIWVEDRGTINDLSRFPKDLYQQMYRQKLSTSHHLNLRRNEMLRRENFLRF